MKNKITKAEYNYIVNTKLRSDVDSGMPGHIEDHELIANKIAHAGSLPIGHLSRTGEDAWSMSLIHETAGMYEQSGLTTEAIQGEIDSLLSASNRFAVYPTDESITNLAETPLYESVVMHVSGETSLAELLSTFHIRVNHIVQDNYGPTLQAIEPALQDLTAQIEALEGEVSTLESDNSSLSTTVSTLESDSASLSTTVSQLGEDITTLSNANSTLKGQVSTLESDNVSLNATVSGLESDLGSLSSANDTLNSTVSTLEGNVATLTSDKEALEGQVSTLESTIADLTTRLEALENATNPE